MTMMSLGMFAFGLSTVAYQKLKRRTDWRHARQPRIGARDAVQYLGPGEDTITLAGVAMAELQAAVPGYAHYDRGRWSIADPRETPVEPIAALPAAKDRLVARIVALDGTWHRPFTTLELAALQSLFDPGEVFDLKGGPDQLKREWIGNAVPSAAARGMAETIGETLLLATLGETFTLSSPAIWTRPLALALAVDPRQPIDGIDA